ncbi:hypothetical protein KIN20_007098 [Parelaphostrongylus tenuis]|uniref:Uncharacterized protein n=1 Tax=Parelaphostrongylus tenuis TaxID=148309 RepID=A0AAD5QJS2_PARTN|nr:hypothetical protein KIN20_007098 [Parelaphostrongylus tenuis]
MLSNSKSDAVLSVGPFTQLMMGLTLNLESKDGQARGKDFMRISVMGYERVNDKTYAADISWQEFFSSNYYRPVVDFAQDLRAASLMILLLVSISTVFGCGVVPGGQTSTRTFTAGGPSNLPIIAVYTDNKVISTLFPGIATSKDAVQALAQRFAMQTVVDVLEIEGRRALLPDFVISNILSQLRVNTAYEPLLCRDLKKPDAERKSPEVDIR